MFQNALRLALGAGVGLTLLGAAGCDYDEHENHHHGYHEEAVISSPAPYAAYQPADVDVVAVEPPPPPQYEVVQAAPSPDYIWIGGDWTYVNNRYEWRRGHWDRRPAPEAHWVAPRWERTNRGWEHHPGQWQSSEHRREEYRRD